MIKSARTVGGSKRHLRDATEGQRGAKRSWDSKSQRNLEDSGAELHLATEGHRLERRTDEPVLMVGVVVGWLVNVPATCECTSGTDLLRQFYVLPR